MQVFDLNTQLDTFNILGKNNFQYALNSHSFTVRTKL